LGNRNKKSKNHPVPAIGFQKESFGGNRTGRAGPELGRRLPNPQKKEKKKKRHGIQVGLSKNSGWGWLWRYQKRNEKRKPPEGGKKVVPPARSGNAKVSGCSQTRNNEKFPAGKKDL